MQCADNGHVPSFEACFLQRESSTFLHRNATNLFDLQANVRNRKLANAIKITVYRVFKNRQFCIDATKK